jgi:hypothetical protein
VVRVVTPDRTVVMVVISVEVTVESVVVLVIVSISVEGTVVVVVMSICSVS